MATKRKRKTSAEPYLIIPRRTVQSQEINALSVHSRWLYVILVSQYNRTTKEDFILTYKQINEITGFDDRRISSCIKELVKAEFLEVSEKGGLLKNPNQYSLDLGNWLGINGVHKK